MIGNNFYISIATTDRSADLMKMEIMLTPETKEAIINRPGSSLPVKSSQSGAMAYEINCEWDQILTAGGCFYQLQDLLLSGSPFTVVAAQNGSTPSTSNRVWTGSAIISGGLPAGGQVGERLKYAVKFVCASNSGWTFAIA